MSAASRLAGHVLVAALCLEVAARLDDRLTYGAPFWARYDADVIRTQDSEGLVRNVPGTHFEKWQINPLGFRGEEVAVDKPAGRRRVACLGTSETFGLYERRGGEWPAKLGQLLRERHAEAEVLNASVVGLNHDTRQRYIDKYVLPLHPDVIVLYLNVLSDAAHWAAAAGGGVATASGARNSASTWDRLPAPRVLPKLQRSLKAAFPERIWNGLRTWRAARKVARSELSMMRGRRPLDGLPAQAVDAFERHLRELVSAQRERGIMPVLATYPTLGTASNRDAHRLAFLSQREGYFTLSDMGLIAAAAQLNDAARRVASEVSVPLADADAVVPKTSEYFADYVHYTDKGAELVAATVLDAVERARLLERSAPLTAGRAPRSVDGSPPRQGIPGTEYR